MRIETLCGRILVERDWKLVGYIGKNSQTCYGKRLAYPFHPRLDILGTEAEARASVLKK